MLKYAKIMGLMLTLVGMSACAVRDLPTTPPPPLTLVVPPTVVYAGVCEDNSTLEAWLQKASFTRDDFMILLDTASIQARGDLRDEVQDMADKRTSVSAMPVPDCAVEPHLIMLDAMNQAVDTFQRYINGELETLGNVVADTKQRLTTFDVYLIELTDRLEAQYQFTPTPPTLG